MKKALLILAVLFVSGFASKSLIDEISPLWQIWKDRYQKTYAEEEEVERFAIFARNYERIMKYNAESDSARLALNKFADMTNEEFASKNSRCAYAETDEEFIRANTIAPQNIGALPANVDWRNHGAVTPIKNQGQCGSCWTFSTTGVLEGWHFLKSGKLLSFSEQQIVDCDTGTNQGCDGGYPYLAVEYAAKNGLELESDYPYTAEDGDCKYDKSKTTQVAGGYKFVTADSTDALKTALVAQPVSVLIEADQDAFQFYSSGVLKTGCGASLDHAVLAVGYTKVGVLEAFIVKNSWGTDWGEQGYVYIWDEQNVNSNKGVCGILSQPMVPTS
jgi:C1A family cysteine protease